MNPALLPLDEAVAIATRTAEAVRDARPPETRVVSLWEASGRVMAQDVRADRDHPPFDKSMMDGFALRTADLAAGRTLRLVGEIAAGDMAAHALGPGEAMAIMTGAPLPAGADAVEIVEIAVRDGERVTFPQAVAPEANLQRAGCQVRKGDVVVERGRVVEALTAGVLGTVGAARFAVYERPRVSVIATGNELLGVEATPGPAQIRDSNRRTLMALLESEHCRVVDGGIVRDERAALRQAIAEAKESDVLVLSGGVSAGEYDLVRGCLEAEGAEILFHQIAIKPGKPVLFGRMRGSAGSGNDTLVFGLPGNPVSAFVTAVLLLAPVVRVLGRRPEHKSWTLSLPLAGPLPATQRRTTIHPGDLVRGPDDALSVRPRAWDGSSDHIAYARGNVLIRRDAGQPAAGPGELTKVILPRSLATW
ncbi:MAG: gephyrin-like molybdotransferase Glp [Myxococcota bacterium]